MTLRTASVAAVCLCVSAFMNVACSSTMRDLSAETAGGAGAGSAGLADAAGGQTHAAGANSAGSEARATGGSNEGGASAGGSSFGGSNVGGSSAGGEQALGGTTSAAGTANTAGSSSAGANSTAGAGGRAATCEDATEASSNALMCADPICLGKRCQTKTQKLVYPTKDFQRTKSSHGTGDKDGDVEIRISTSDVASEWTVFEFANMASDSALTIHQAKLKVYLVAGNVRLEARDPDNTKLDAPDPESIAGFRTFDVTTLVKAWANKTESRKFLSVVFGGTPPGGVKMRASEYAGTTFDPVLEVEYEAACTAQGSCPQP